MEESMTINFSNLEKLSKKINEASDELTKALTCINEKLNSLNLGLEVWCSAPLDSEPESSQNPDENEIPTEQIFYLGYGKLADKWGILVRNERWTDPSNYRDRERVCTIETSFLLSSSRALRIKAINEIPALISLLEEEGESFTKSVSKAKELADEL
ncbi:MAG: hypothetical protein LAP85_09610 [Acidobacteriia bacterium]|nr:hypothetical protein [Terriglobia bacterium]